MATNSVPRYKTQNPHINVKKKIKERKEKALKAFHEEHKKIAVYSYNGML